MNKEIFLKGHNLPYNAVVFSHVGTALIFSTNIAHKYLRCLLLSL